MKTVWTYDLKGARSVSQRAPIVHGNQVIVTMNHGVGNFNGVIAALCLETGSERWRFERPHIFAQPVVTGDGSIFATGFDGFAHKIGRDGQLLWSTDVSEQNLWSGILLENRFIFSEIAGGALSTWALDAETGQEAWRYDDGGHSYGVAHGGGNCAVITSASGSFDKSSYSLHSVDIQTGRGRWRSTYPEILFRPVLFQDVIVVGSRGRVVAFDPANGSPVSEARIQGAADFECYPVARNDRVFLASTCGHIIALKLERKRGFFGGSKISLSPVWEARLGSGVEFFSEDHGQLICLTKGGNLEIIDPENGSHRISAKLSRFENGMGATATGANGFITAVNRACARIQL